MGPNQAARRTGSISEKGLPLTEQVCVAWRSYQHEHHDRDRLKAEIAPIQAELRQLLQDASPKSGRNRWHRQFAMQPPHDLARTLDLHHHHRRRADQQPRRTRPPRPGHPPKTLARHPKQQRRALRRTRPVRRRDPPPTKPLTVRLPARPPRRAQPRRPPPRAHLSQGPGTERLESAGINRPREGDGNAPHRRTSDRRWPRVMESAGQPAWRREWKSPTLKI